MTEEQKQEIAALAEDAERKRLACENPGTAPGDGDHEARVAYAVRCRVLEAEWWEAEKKVRWAMAEL